jgi:hypothetical protein
MEMSGGRYGFLSRKKTVGLPASLVIVKVFVALNSVMPEVTGCQTIGSVSEGGSGGGGSSQVGVAKNSLRLVTTRATLVLWRHPD